MLSTMQARRQQNVKDARGAKRDTPGDHPELIHHTEATVHTSFAGAALRVSRNCGRLASRNSYVNSGMDQVRDALTCRAVGDGCGLEQTQLSSSGWGDWGLRKDTVGHM